MRETILKSFISSTTIFKWTFVFLLHTPDIKLVIAYCFITSHIYSHATPTQYDPVHIELGHLASTAVCPLQHPVPPRTLPPPLPGPPPQAHHHLPAPRAGGARGELQGRVWLVCCTIWIGPSLGGGERGAGLTLEASSPSTNGRAYRGGGWIWEYGGD